LITLEKIKKRAESDAKTYGYFLTPDPDLLQDLLEGLETNEERYGYPSCPCRLASGQLELDRDIICPCDYRDPDVIDYGQCYCGLYVNKYIHDGKKDTTPIPERRPPEKQDRASLISSDTSTQDSLETDKKIQKSLKIQTKLWYCKQCGYICFREDPPYICPICKAKKEMFTELNMIVNVGG
jgi:ferredoxin-thioredoxin reductase catalytic subunit